MINSIQDETGAEITIEDDGTIYVGAEDGLSAQAAVDRINAIANPQMPKVGERFLGTVVKTAAFGAFVSLLPGKDGLMHISKLGRGKRIGKVEDVVNVGDKMQVEIAEIDQRGKISLVLVDDEAATGRGRAGPRRGVRLSSFRSSDRAPCCGSRAAARCTIAADGDGRSGVPRLGLGGLKELPERGPGAGRRGLHGGAGLRAGGAGDPAVRPRVRGRPHRCRRRDQRVRLHAAAHRAVRRPAGRRARRAGGAGDRHRHRGRLQRAGRAGRGLLAAAGPARRRWRRFDHVQRRARRAC